MNVKMKKKYLVVYGNLYKSDFRNDIVEMCKSKFDNVLQTDSIDIIANKPVVNGIALDNKNCLVFANANSEVELFALAARGFIIDTMPFVTSMLNFKSILASITSGFGINTIQTYSNYYPRSNCWGIYDFSVPFGFRIVKADKEKYRDVTCSTFPSSSICSELVLIHTWLGLPISTILVNTFDWNHYYVKDVSTDMPSFITAEINCGRDVLSKEMDDAGRAYLNSLESRLTLGGYDRLLLNKKALEIAKKLNVGSAEISFIVDAGGQAVLVNVNPTHVPLYWTLYPDRFARVIKTWANSLMEC